jgi:sec-independent protein translocase protein TatC
MTQPTDIAPAAPAGKPVRTPRKGAPGNDEVEAHRMPLLEHLKELRRRLIFALLATLAGSILGFLFFEPLYALLTAPIRCVFYGPQNDMDVWYLWLTAPMQTFVGDVTVSGELIQGSDTPLDGVYTYFRVSVIAGLVLASPVIAYQIWQFIAPGLYHTERRVVMPLAFASSFLFSLGAFFCYAVILPLTLPFFLTVIEAAPKLAIGGYLQSVVSMMGSFGLCFQLPIATWFLARLGLIDHIDMIKGFRYAVIVIVFVAAVLTPPDVLTQILLSVPLVILYGVGILVARFATTKKRS